MLPWRTFGDMQEVQVIYDVRQLEQGIWHGAQEPLKE